MLSYRKVPTLFSQAERSFYGVLEQAAGKDFRIFGKVRVGDVLSPARGLHPSARQIGLNKLNRKHFDYVLCDPGDLSIRCAIELNDSSHDEKVRQERDEFLAGACRSAGLPLIVFEARRAYPVGEVGARIAEVVTRPSARFVQQNALAAKIEEVQKEACTAGDLPQVPLCPRCASEMVKRFARGGENAGKAFWGCSNFPKCREVVVI